MNDHIRFRGAVTPIITRPMESGLPYAKYLAVTPLKQNNTHTTSHCGNWTAGLGLTAPDLARRPAWQKPWAHVNIALEELFLQDIAY